MLPRVRVLGSRWGYKGKVIQVRVDRVIEPGEVEAQREVVCHSGSVVVLPRLPDGGILMVRQYRYATRKRLWELVAGGIEPGESPSEAARRELLEETGYLARTIRPLLAFYPSPGFLDEQMRLMEARGLQPGKARPEADERIELGKFTLAHIRKMLRGGKIEDGKTLIGLLWLFVSSSPED